uniref:C2 domain-containing protein n=1 Tax=Electrophorus electricus TaxID=8005 RepID=A0A4W4E061_ELEEL
IASPPPLHQEFLQAVKSLYPTYDSQSYQNIIDRFDLYGDQFSRTDASVEVIYGDLIMHTAVIHGKDNPRWSESFEFGSITISLKNKLTFNVYDEDTYWNSDLLGTCDFDLKSGKWSEVCIDLHDCFHSVNVSTCALCLLHHPDTTPLVNLSVSLISSYL